MSFCRLGHSHVLRVYAFQCCCKFICCLSPSLHKVMISPQVLSVLLGTFFLPCFSSINRGILRMFHFSRRSFFYLELILTICIILCQVTVHRACFFVIILEYIRIREPASIIFRWAKVRIPSVRSCHRTSTNWHYCSLMFFARAGTCGVHRPDG
jgi:hypothetical protein